jgi:hypothetical protein
MSAEDDELAAVTEELALTQRATVYTGSNWTTVDRTGLKCSFTPADRQAAATGRDRADLALSGTLEWERGYAMPSGARIEIDAYPGIRFNVQRGTILASLGPGNGALNWTAEVVRILT